MKPTEEEIIAFINADLEEMLPYALSVLRASADKKKLSISGETLDSLSGEVIKASGTALAKLTISFSDVGRLKDMRVVTHTKPLPQSAIIKEILAFVKAKGVSSFKFVPGYKTMPADSEKAALRIAWGIGKGITKGKWVRKAWYSKKKGAIINLLAERMIVNYQQITAKSGAEILSFNGNS